MWLCFGNKANIQSQHCTSGEGGEHESALIFVKWQQNFVQDCIKKSINNVEIEPFSFFSGHTAKIAVNELIFHI